MPPTEILLALCGIGGIVVGAVAAAVVARLAGSGLVGKARREEAQIISDAERKAAAILRDAATAVKEQRGEMLAQVEAESRQMRKELMAWEKRILAKEEGVDKRIDALEKKANELGAKEHQLANREKAQEREKERIAALIEEGRYPRALWEKSG